MLGGEGKEEVNFHVGFGVIPNIMTFFGVEF